MHRMEQNDGPGAKKRKMSVLDESEVMSVTSELSESAPLVTLQPRKKRKKSATALEEKTQVISNEVEDIIKAAESTSSKTMQPRKKAKIARRRKIQPELATVEVESPEPSSQSRKSNNKGFRQKTRLSDAITRTTRAQEWKGWESVLTTNPEKIVRNKNVISK